MIREREIQTNRYVEDRWILTPNFQRLVLSIIESGGQVPTSAILKVLQKAKREGENGSFPPYFDVTSAVDLIGVLRQLEESKLLVHTRNKDLDDDIWILTLGGLKRITNPDLTELKQPEKIKQIEDKETQVQKRKNGINSSPKAETREQDKLVKQWRKEAGYETARIKLQEKRQIREAEKSRRRIEKRQAIEAARERSRRARGIY